MRSVRREVVKAIGIIAGLMIAVPSTMAAGMVYRLMAGSSYGSGCFGPCPCKCSIWGGYLSGSFFALPLEPEDGFQVFNIPDLRWYMHCLVPDCPPILVRGSGTFRINLDEQVQRLELDLEYVFHPVEHYDSGLVPVHEDFPEIAVGIVWRKDCCFLTSFHLKASPLHFDPLQLDGDLEVGFELPARPVDEPVLRGGDRQAPTEVSTWGAIKALYRARNE